MAAAVNISFLSAFALVIIGFMQCAEDCGDTQQNVENGMIRLPDFSGETIRNVNCSWTYTAPPGRKLLVKVDSVHLPPLELRISQLQLYVDDTYYDIPRNCVKCLRAMVGGKVLKVIFTSNVAFPVEEHEVNASNALIESIGSFQLRYKAFDPLRCSRPEQIENGFIVGKGKKLGQTIFYHCNPPYDMMGESSLTCGMSEESPVPEWSSKSPNCVIEECSEQPIIKKTSPGAIATPGYPSYLHDFLTPCIWEVIAQPNQQIKVSVTYLRFPKHFDHAFPDNSSRLSLIDGDSGSYIVNLTESVRNGPLNFTTLTNKLTVEFTIVNDGKRKDETGLYLDYSFVSSSCPEPIAPENGEVIAHSNELESVVAYKCLQGYVLVGEFHVECLLNGQWSHPAPSCEPINMHMPSFLAASNDSDTVTAKLSDLPDVPESPKQYKNEKKKLTEATLVKEEVNVTELQEKPIVPKDFRNNGSPTSSDNVKGSNGKKSDKDLGNGPKSEPHLLQVVPPKINDKKPTDDQTSSVNRPSPGNATKESIPSLETGYNKESDGVFFELTDTMIYIIAGVSGPVLLITILVVVIVVYRRKYPVRMRFGRKFSTFENPMYVSKDAHHPRELKRLTT